jgi:phospholipid/cholesterol/gamma-HCH transport system substrate-binding protein
VATVQSSRNGGGLQTSRPSAAAGIGRLAGIGALVIAVVALFFVLTSGGSTYVLHAVFSDAGQLVSGDRVTIGGVQVGSVGPITLTNNGLANVELDISSGPVPLRQGTMATIGELSLTGVANRFVSITPGTGDPILSGGILPETQTRGIVDLDTLLNAFTPRVRSALDSVLAQGARLFAHPTASEFNRASEFLWPAASQLSELGRQVVADRPVLAQLISATGHLSSALAAPQTHLGDAVDATAVVLRRIAAERSSLQDILSRAPSVLRHATGTLSRVRQTLQVVDPALVRLTPVARRLPALLQALVPATRNAVPMFTALRALIPGFEAALVRLPGVVRLANPAVASLTSVVKAITPALSSFRPYAPDVVSGFFNGVGGASDATYDANGHFLQGMLTIQGGGSSVSGTGGLSGLLNLLGKLIGKKLGHLGPFHGERTKLVAPCPGGGNPPAPDHSNPWVTPDLLPGATLGVAPLCLARDDQR